MPRKIVVTGGAGFIGSALARALVARGDDVSVLDNLTTGKRENLREVADQLTIVEGDILDAALLDRVFSGADVVFHEAAIPSVPRSLAAPLPSHNANATGTLNVLEAARRCQVRRVVYAGSSSAYGEPPSLPVVETMAPAPLSPYAVSKLAGEHYLRVYARVFGVQTVTLRYFNVFGPRQDPNSQYAAVIPRFITAALEGRSPTVYGDGEQSRDFCFIDNVVEANLRAADAEGASGKLFNIACGTGTSLNRVLALLGEALGRPVVARYEPGRAGDVRHSLADISQAKTVLGYTAAVNFVAGLGKTLAWFQQQRSTP
ncbi:MAG TPA: SDR family oxidoreductase [Polyangia bacterium]|jgi:UDP-glucose 4-epimerase|nr:SDR family oxidoreductase [Polyangia bacterium]